MTPDEPYLCYPYLALGVFALLAADVGVVLRASVTGPLFATAWLVLATVAGWWWMVCVPLLVEVDGGRLRYQSPARAGSVPLRRVRTLRPLLGTAAVVRLRGRVPMMVPVRRGFAPVAAALSGHPCRARLSSP